MSEEIVLYQGNSPLYLTDVKRDEGGALKSGYVTNGCWTYRVKGKEGLACDGNFIVNRWPLDLQELEEVQVPTEMRGKHYDVVIEWADTQRVKK